MEKTEPTFNGDSIESLVSEFNLGIAKKLNAAGQDQPIKKDSIDLCLPPLLVEAFQNGLEKERSECSCGCGDGQDCAQPASSSGHDGCGGCNHHA